MIQPSSLTVSPTLASTGSALLSQGAVGAGRSQSSEGGQFHDELSRASDTLGAAQRGANGRGGGAARSGMNGKAGRASQATEPSNAQRGKTAGKTSQGRHSSQQNHADDQDSTPRSDDDSKSNDKSKASDKKSGPSQDPTDGASGQNLATSATTSSDPRTDDTSSATGTETEAAANVTDALLPVTTNTDDPSVSTAAKDGSTVKNTTDNATDFQNLVAQAGAEPASSARSDAQSPAAAQAPPPPQTAAAPQDPNVARVARGLQNALQQNGGSVTLRLQPPDLGSVKIQMDIHDGMASVEFQTDRPAVSDLLGHQLASLRDALQTHGLVVDKMEVRTATPTLFGTAGQQADSSPGDGRSRGEFLTRQQNGGSSPQQAALTPEGESFDDVMVNAVA